MAKRTFPSILHAAESWDADLASWKLNLDTAIPVPEPTGGLYANLPAANQNDRGLCAVNETASGWILVLSDGTSWRRIPWRAASHSDSAAATLAAFLVEFNAFLAKLRASGALAP